jgi:sugar lactone lactonase YvrE
MTLGEGPVWVERDKALWFVDIKERRVYRFDPSPGSALQIWEAPDQIGWLLPSTEGGFLVGLASGLHRFNPSKDQFDLYRVVEPHLPGNRLNDAGVDRAGRVWFGSMDDAEREATGRLYCLENGKVRDCGLKPIGVTNGPALPPDGRTLYAVDSLGGTISAYSISEEGLLSDGRVFVQIDPAQGIPDGAVCDSEGGVWVGVFRGSVARRYAPSGMLTDEVRFPVSNITKIALGGPDGRTGFATTARMGLDAAGLAAEPLAGDLFKFRVDIPGVPVVEVALD